MHVCYPNLPKSIRIITTTIPKLRIYSKIIVESMGGSGDNDYEKEVKIIKNIPKNIMVE